MQISYVWAVCSALFLPLFYAEAFENFSIPQPRSASSLPGEFTIGKTDISAPDSLDNEAHHLANGLKALGFTPQPGRAVSAAFVLKLGGIEGSEAYKLIINPNQIIIQGSDKAGVFYGIQTLLQQLFHACRLQETTLECGIIEDAPRYPWRGFMLDEARHFFGKEKVLQILDNMARFKLNKFHWHLTDEPGWRLEIKQFPKLASVGGKGSWSQPNDPSCRFYTQDEIKEIIQYAASRHIEIIPEIDMPGHATAANRAYPEYSGGGTPDHPHYTFNPGKEKTYEFLTRILEETSQLFPSAYFHLGGDEVAFASKSWDSLPEVQQLKERENLKSNKEVEGYFVRKMIRQLHEKTGKIAIGWDEMLDAQVPKDHTILMWWRHDRVPVLKEALAQGYRVVMCPRRPLYFDFLQHKSHKWGRVWGGFCPIQDVYEFPDKGFALWNIPTEQQTQIMGLQANLWTERISTPQRVDFMTWPRLCAAAESAWSIPSVKNFDDFSRRLEEAYVFFDQQEIYYFDTRDPERRKEPAGCEKNGNPMPMDYRD